MRTDHAMQTYLRWPVEFVSGRGLRSSTTPRGASTSTWSPESRSPASGTRIPTVAKRDRGPSRQAAARLEPVRHRTGVRPRANGWTTSPGCVVLLQLGGRGDRVRDQAGAEVGDDPTRRGSLRDRVRRWRFPRTHARSLDGDRSAGQEGGVRTAPSVASRMFRSETRTRWPRRWVTTSSRYSSSRSRAKPA